MTSLEFASLRKTFGSTTALVDVNFRCEPGEITVMTGASEAGKTTALRIAAGLTHPSDGQVLFGGTPLSGYRHPANVAGFCLDPTATHPGRSVRATLTHAALLAGAGKRDVKPMAEFIGLKRTLNTAAGDLPPPQQYRLALGVALLGNPDVVVLDEPFDHLTDADRPWLVGLLRSLANNGKTVLVSCGLDVDTTDFADRIITMRLGRISKDLRCDESAPPSGSLAQTSAPAPAPAVYDEAPFREVEEPPTRAGRRAGLVPGGQPVASVTRGRAPAPATRPGGVGVGAGRVGAGSSQPMAAPSASPIQDHRPAPSASRSQDHLPAPSASPSRRAFDAPPQPEPAPRTSVIPQTRPVVPPEQAPLAHPVPSYAVVESEEPDTLDDVFRRYVGDPNHAFPASTEAVSAVADPYPASDPPYAAPEVAYSATATTHLPPVSVPTREVSPTPAVASDTYAYQPTTPAATATSSTAAWEGTTPWGGSSTSSRLEDWETAYRPSASPVLPSAVDTSWDEPGTSYAPPWEAPNPTDAAEPLTRSWGLAPTIGIPASTAASFATDVSLGNAIPSGTWSSSTDVPEPSSYSAHEYPHDTTSSATPMSMYDQVASTTFAVGSTDTDDYLTDYATPRATAEAGVAGGQRGSTYGSYSGVETWPVASELSTPSEGWRDHYLDAPPSGTRTTSTFDPWTPNETRTRSHG